MMTGCFLIDRQCKQHPFGRLWRTTRGGCRSGRAMAKRKPRTPNARTPVAVAKFKQLFLKQLEKGRSPGVAARNIKIARSAVYSWRKADQEFDAAWKDAVETGLDVVETKIYDRAVKDSPEDARFLMRYRRYERDRPDSRQPNNFILNVTLQEQYKRLERLGIPLPVIETDCEEENVAKNNP
jgi:hypothetical protein